MATEILPKRERALFKRKLPGVLLRAFSAIVMIVLSHVSVVVVTIVEADSAHSGENLRSDRGDAAVEAPLSSSVVQATKPDAPEKGAKGLVTIPSKVYITLVSLIVILIPTFLLWAWEARVAYLDDLSEKQILEDLRGCLYVGLTILSRLSSSANSAKIRITIHRRNADEQRVEQLLDYVMSEGTCPGSGGRKFNDKEGIVGKAISAKDLFNMDRLAGSSQDAYLDELAKTYGIEKERGRTLTGIEQMSFIAAPLQNEADVVVGVLYADCDESGFFARKEVIDSFLNIAEGIVRYRKSLP